MAVSTTLSMTDPAELPRAAAALGRHADGIDAVEKGVTAACRRIEREAADVVARLESRCRAAEEAARRARDEERAQAEQAAARARVARDAGRRAQQEISRTLGDLRREVHGHVSRTRSLADQGARGLRSLWERLDRARSAFESAVARHRSPGNVADPARLRGGGASRSSRPGPDEHTEGPVEQAFDRMLEEVKDEVLGDLRDRAEEVLEDYVRDALGGADEDGSGPSSSTSSSSSGSFPVLDGERLLLPLDQLVDHDPISGPEAFEKISLPRMQQGLALLEEQVLPAVRRGVGREGIRALDVQAGTAGSPDGLLAVYDAFFGGVEHAVVVTRGADGRFEVQAGRHRFWAARRVHLEALPVVVR